MSYKIPVCIVLLGVATFIFIGFFVNIISSIGYGNHAMPDIQTDPQHCSPICELNSTVGYCNTNVCNDVERCHVRWYSFCVVK